MTTNSFLIERIAEGRTDLVFELEATTPASQWTDRDGLPVLKWCAYYGDVSAIRFLLGKGESLATLGPNLDLNGAAFHGHWQLCQYLIGQGADANHPMEDSGGTPLHVALCKAGHPSQGPILKVLLAAGADPNAACPADAPTGCFMRDCRTRGETPLHRAAAYGSADSIQLLLDAGARREARDCHGDSPLTWASWHLRPAPVLRLLCFGTHRLHPDYAGLEAHLTGNPLPGTSTSAPQDG